MGNLMHKQCVECLEKNAPDPTHRTGEVDCINCSTVNPVINMPNLYSAHRIKDIDCANCTTKCITIFTPKIYNCEQCGNIMVLDDVLSSECPWCRIPIYKHKKCGSKVTLK
jgi:hypothetical protein